MNRLRVGYILSGIITGFVLMIAFLTSLPDGTLLLVFCNVGQGDATYIRFSDGRDMLIDGGPTNAVVSCLSKYMPFWDRRIDMVVLTHPQKDHMQGLIDVLSRYDVTYFLHSDITNNTEGFRQLTDILRTRHITERFAVKGEKINIGGAQLSIVWPSTAQIARMKPPEADGATDVLGVSSGADVNDGSVVLWLRYGTFDALFPGDADMRVEAGYRGFSLADKDFEVLKVPHHGSRTGMSKEYVQWLSPQTAVISVGKNSYGHPAGEILSELAETGAEVLRTDTEGDIVIVSDGRAWQRRE